MLALREMHISPPHPQLSLLDLPDEILDHITNCVYNDSGCYLPSIIAASLTCRRLRKATLPILFHTITLVDSHGVLESRSYNLMMSLMSPDEGIARYVRHLKMAKLATALGEECGDGTTRQMLSKDQMVQILSRLRVVRSISVYHPNLAALDALCQVAATPLHIAIHCCIQAGSPESVNDAARLGSIFARTLPGSRLSITNFPQSIALWLLIMMGLQERAISACHWSPSGSGSMIRKDLGFMQRLEMLEELHLGEDSSLQYPFGFESISQTVIKLKRLRRLSASGTIFAGGVLKIVNQLDRLEGLRLHSGSETLFHGHLNSNEHQGLPYLSLPQLMELEIRYISRYLSIGHIISPRLQNLRLEYRARTDRLRAFDLRWMVQSVPDLECLEVNVGGLSNLWHPTAVAGVDVDVEVYQLLDALASFKKLRRLRLFPPYWKSQGGFLNFVQPVSDEQAVRIHQYLVNRIPGLQMLIISSTHADYMLKQEIYARDATEPMKWVVRSCGTKSILTTHQAGENYELEQVWEGERRLSMKTIPHRYRHRHFDELHGWIVPAFEFPFDRPTEP